ncbi:MAG: J domain-containing protein [Planctomycetes bacterium]|nr:J domain-containing protein [Planctomycetota bacterium]
MTRVLKRNQGVDYYEVLQVSTRASQDEIRRSFKKLVLEFHPDKNPDRRESAERRIRELIEAYEILGDDHKRRSFDQIRRQRPAAGSDEPYFLRRKGPGSRALTVLHHLLNGRSDEGVSILDEMETEYGGDYLREFLDRRDYLDCLFLLGEHHARKKEYVAAVNRLRTFYFHERNAKFPRHYLDEVVRLLKDLYLRKLPKVVAPKLLIGYLQEAAMLELSMPEGVLRLRKLAEALLRMGDCKAARQALSEIEKIDPDAKEARRVEKMLQQKCASGGAK